MDPLLQTDVFLWDRDTGVVTLVSHAFGSSTQAGNDRSGEPRISADGRFVAFASMATDLVAGSSDGGIRRNNIYLWNRETGTTLLVSHPPGLPSQTANGSSSHCQLSADGRYVTYQSSATDLTSGLSPGANGDNIFLFDRLSGGNILVNHIAGTSSADPSAESYAPSISDDGRFIAFSSSSTQLVAGAIYPTWAMHLFLFDRTTGLNALVSHSSTANGTAANDSSSLSPRISGDGGWIVFESAASDLVAGQVDPEYSSDVFLYERATGIIQLVNRVAGTTATVAPGGGSPSINADGSAVVYSSEATGIVAGLSDANQRADVFLFDRATGTNRLVSHRAGSPGETANSSSDSTLISPDGSHVAFFSEATNLVAGAIDEAETTDVFLWDRASDAVTLVSHRNGHPLDAVAGIGHIYTAISGSGSHLAFVSSATDLTAANDTNEAIDVFLFARAGGLNTMISFTPPIDRVATGDFLGRARVDAQGRYVAFDSAATRLAPQEDDNQALDVFVADRLTGAIEMVSQSVRSPGQAANGSSGQAEISADGNWILFTSTATDLTAGQVDLPGTQDVFLFGRTDGSRILVSRTAASPLAAAGSCFGGSLSADGRFVAFGCTGADLIPGQLDMNGIGDVFLFDRITGTTALVSHSSGSLSQTGNAGANFPVISAGGGFIAYSSGASDLVPGQIDPVSGEDLFLYDRLEGSTVLVTRANGSPVEAANGQTGGGLALSSDASWIGFSSTAARLVPGVNEGSPSTNGNVFLFERSTGTITLASRSSMSSSLPGNGSSRGVGLSQDGRWIAFQSFATDLVPGQSDTAATADVFLHDRQEGTTVLVSHTANSWTEAAGAGGLGGFLLSADGSRVAFQSAGTGLVAGQTDANEGFDFFLYDRLSRAIELVSHVPSSPIVTGGLADMYTRLEALSGDGRVALFASSAQGLAAGDYNMSNDLFAHTSLMRDPALLDFYTLPPCRALDTRLPQDGPALVSGTEVVFALSGACGAPATARALAVNVTVIQATGSGYLTFFPGGAPRPVSSTINFRPLNAQANNAIVSLAANGSGTLAVYPFVAGNGTVHLILDVAGYFE